MPAENEVHAPRLEVQPQSSVSAGDDPFTRDRPGPGIRERVLCERRWERVVRCPVGSERRARIVRDAVVTEVGLRGAQLDRRAVRFGQVRGQPLRPRRQEEADVAVGL